MPSITIHHQHKTVAIFGRRRFLVAIASLLAFATPSAAFSTALHHYLATNSARPLADLCALENDKNSEEPSFSHHHHHDETVNKWSRTTSMIPISLLERSSWEDDRKPRRNYLSSEDAATQTRRQQEKQSLGLPREKFFPSNEWGIHDAASNTAASVSTVSDSTETKNVPETSFTPTKPGLPVFPCALNQVADAAVDAIREAVLQTGCQGRLSIEIDGTQHLLLDETMAAGTGAGNLRKLALAIAERLAKLDMNKDDSTAEEANQEQPVAVYLNTIKQTMLAAYEYRDIVRTWVNNLPPSNVTILSLGDELPATMHPAAHQTNTNPKSRTATINHSRGFVVVVQPTDYNDEHQPPGPSVGTMEALQRLTLRASLMGYTVVLISPRFLASPYYPDSSMMPCWQRGDGTRQVAAFFGGLEPARQPAPWLMRDFSPPVFSWVAHGVSLSPPPVNDGDAPLRRYTRVALMQSGARSDWHMFGARQERGDDAKKRHVSYDYLASTIAASGRPTRQVMRQIYEEFHQ